MLTRKLKDNPKDANTADNLYATHTLSNAGKEETVVANYDDDFWKKFQKVIQYSGK